MTGIGTVSAGEMFTEQVELKGRTTDPANAEPGEYWVRTDQTSSNPQVVAELRRQNTSGVSKIPVFADSEETNLGSQMVRGPSVVLDDGTVGFVAMASDSKAKFGSPRVVTAAGTEYLSHNSLKLSAIPDSVTQNLLFRYEFKDSSTSGTAVDESPNNNDGTISGATYVADSPLGDNALSFDDAGDKIDTGLNFIGGGSWTVMGFVKADPSPGKDVINCRSDRMKISYAALQSNGWEFSILDSNGTKTVDSGDTRTGEWLFLAAQYDDTAGEMQFWIGDLNTQISSQGTLSVGTPRTDNGNNATWGQDGSGGDDFYGDLDVATVVTSAIPESDIEQFRSAFV